MVEGQQLQVAWTEPGHLAWGQSAQACQTGDDLKEAQMAYQALNHR